MHCKQATLRRTLKRLMKLAKGLLWLLRRGEASSRREEAAIFYSLIRINANY